MFNAYTVCMVAHVGDTLSPPGGIWEKPAWHHPIAQSKTIYSMPFPRRITRACCPILNSLHDLGNELVPLPDSLRRVIDKTYLHGIPARAKVFGHIRQKERGELLVFTPHSGVLIVDHWFFEISTKTSCSAGGIAPAAAKSAVVSLFSGSRFTIAPPFVLLA
jgi:hypothetical protein